MSVIKHQPKPYYTYECQYCGKRYDYKHDTVQQAQQNWLRHQKGCEENPEAKCCLTCVRRNPRGDWQSCDSNNVIYDCEQSHRDGNWRYYDTVQGHDECDNWSNDPKDICSEYTLNHYYFGYYYDKLHPEHKFISY